MKTYIIFNGAFLCIMSCLYGINSAWGLIEPYIISYLIIKDQTINTSSVHILNIMITIAGLPAAYSFISLINVLGYKQSIALSALLSSLGQLLCYFTRNFYLLATAWFLFGVGKHWFKLVGSFMMMQLIPDNIGLANSLANIGTSFSPVYWSWLAFQLQNPNNVSPMIHKTEGQRVVQYFDEKIAENLPTVFLINCVMLLVSGLVIVPLLKQPNSEKSQTSTNWFKTKISKFFRMVFCCCMESETEKVGKKNLKVSDSIAEEKKFLMSNINFLKKPFGSWDREDESKEQKNLENIDNFVKANWKQPKKRFVGILGVNRIEYDCLDEQDQQKIKNTFTIYRCNLDEEQLEASFKNDKKNQKESFVAPGEICPNSEDFSVKFDPKVKNDQTLLEYIDSPIFIQNFIEDENIETKGDIQTKDGPNFKIQLPNFDLTCESQELAEVVEFYEIDKNDDQRHFIKKVSSTSSSNTSLNTSLNTQTLETPLDNNIDSGDSVSSDTSIKELISAFMRNENTQTTKTILFLDTFSVKCIHAGLQYKQVIRSADFWILLVVMSFSIAVPSFYMINMKSFGLQHFNDDVITHTSFIATFCSFTSKILSGILIDKYGSVVTFRIATTIGMIAIGIFYLYGHELVFFYIISGLFFQYYSFISVLMASITSSFYGIVLGRKLQRINYMAWAFSSVLVYSVDAHLLGFYGIGVTTIVLMLFCLILLLLLRKPSDI